MPTLVLGHYLQVRTSNQAVFLLEKDMIHTYVPYLLLPYNKSIKVIEPISLKKRLIEVLSELIKFHEYDNFLTLTVRKLYYNIHINCDWSDMGCKQKSFSICI